MKQLLNIVVLAFGIFAGLFILNRFYDLLQHRESISLVFIFAYCLHVLVILGIGLILFNKQGKIGFWFLLIFESYLIIRHSIEFRNYKLSNLRFEVPGAVLKDLTIPFFELIFATEILLGLISIVLLIKINKR